MKIDPIYNSGILGNYQAVGKVTAKPDVPSKQDSATVSEEALRFSKVLAETKEAMAIRTQEEKEHIEEVAKAVHRGAYRIESDKIADKILESILKR